MAKVKSYQIIDGYTEFLDLLDTPSSYSGQSGKLLGVTETEIVFLDADAYSGNTLDQAYDEGGSGAGRSITVDSGPVELNASGTNALTADGYISLSNISDPTLLINKGSIYVKDDSGDSELFYMDDSGRSTQITKDGLLNADEFAAHATSHISSGSDEIDGDKLDIDWDPTNYVPSTTPSEVDSVDNLTAHLYGIDGYLQTLGSGSEVHLNDLTNPHEVTLDQAYDGSGSGAGRAIAVDNGAVQLNASSGFALDVDGYIEISGAIVGGSTCTIAGNYISTGGNLQVFNGRLTAGYGIVAVGLGTASGLNITLTDVVGHLVNSIRSDAADNIVWASVYDRNAASITNAATMRLHSFGWTDDSRDFNELAAFYADGSLRLLSDGYISLDERSSDPDLVPNAGLLYTKDDSGDTELFYIDSNGNVTQITKDGLLNTSEINLDLDGAYENGRTITIDSGPVVFDGSSSSVHVIDADGYAIFTGDVEVSTAVNGVILKSANGTRFRVTVDNDGNLNTTSI